MQSLTPGILLDALKAGRRLGTITWQKPITAARLVNALFIRYEVRTNAREIREIVNQVCDAGEYIGSNQRGYFYAPTYEEMEAARDFLKARMAEYHIRLAAMNKALERLREPDADMFGHPTADKMKKEFA